MTASTTSRPGRNEPCHCGSGRKYKQCCLAKDEAADAAARADTPAESGASSSGAPAPPAVRAPKHKTDQPWRASNARGFIPRSQTPRKVGGS